MIKLYWALMQLDEDSKDVSVPLPALSFLNTIDVKSLDPSTFYLFTQLIVMTQLRLEEPTDGSAIGVDFKALFDSIVLGLAKSEYADRIVSGGHFASKTNSAIVSEVRACLRKNLPALF